MYFSNPILVALGAFSLGALAQRQIRPYSCLNNENICSNICYWQICVHPDQRKSNQCFLIPPPSACVWG